MIGSIEIGSSPCHCPWTKPAGWRTPFSFNPIIEHNSIGLEDFLGHASMQNKPLEYIRALMSASSFVAIEMFSHVEFEIQIFKSRSVFDTYHEHTTVIGWCHHSNFKCTQEFT
jgi:hypothetical protein